MLAHAREFEEFWTVYPTRNGKKLGKAETYEVFKSKQLYNGNFPELLQATKNYSISSLAQRGFAKDPVRFLRKDYWRDWIEPEISPEDLAKKEADRERIKRELKQAYQDRQTAQGFLDSCEPEDKRYPELKQRILLLTRKIEIMEAK